MRNSYLKRVGMILIVGSVIFCSTDSFAVKECIQKASRDFNSCILKANIYASVGAIVCGVATRFNRTAGAKCYALLLAGYTTMVMSCAVDYSNDILDCYAKAKNE